MNDNNADTLWHIVRNSKNRNFSDKYVAMGWQQKILSLWLSDHICSGGVSKWSISYDKHITFYIVLLLPQDIKVYWELSSHLYKSLM